MDGWENAGSGWGGLNERWDGVDGFVGLVGGGPAHLLPSVYRTSLSHSRPLTSAPFAPI